MRYEDWPERLDVFIEDARNKVFKFGVNDCCIFAARAVESIINIGLLEKVQELHKSKSSRKNLASLVSTTLKTYKFEEVPPLSAQRGDVVIFETVLGDTVGISVGNSIVAPGEYQLEFFPLYIAKRAWRIE